MKRQSIVLLGHGSKSKDAIEDFNFVVENMRSKLVDAIVYGAHMEMATPSLQEVVSHIQETGGNQILILPYFLFNGNHIKQDIPEIIEGLTQQHPDLDIRMGSPIGKEPMMADLMLKKVEEFAF